MCITVFCLNSKFTVFLNLVLLYIRIPWCQYLLMLCIYKSTLVLNSRDWSEIVWLPEISRFKINLAIGFIRKKPTGMHWLGYNDAVSSLNEAKT